MEKRVYGIKNIGDKDIKLDEIVDVLQEMRGADEPPHYDY